MAKSPLSVQVWGDGLGCYVGNTQEQKVVLRELCKISQVPLNVSLVCFQRSYLRCFCYAGSSVHGTHFLWTHSGMSGDELVRVVKGRRKTLVAGYVECELPPHSSGSGLCS